MKEIINFILSKYYEKLTDLQYKYDIGEMGNITEDGEKEQEKLKMKIEIYQEIITGFEDIKCDLYNFLKD